MPRQRHTADSAPSRGDWRADLDRLALALANARPEHGDRYHHAVLLFTGDAGPDLRDTPPRLLAQGHRVRHCLPVALPTGGHLVHVVFDDHPWGASADDFVTFTRALQGVRKTLRSVPATAVPGITVPPLADALDESLAAWLSCLHWVARDPRCVFHAKLEYLDTVESLVRGATFADWAHCPTLADFDPVPFLTSTATGGRELGQWREQHARCGRHFPEVIAASLTKPLWQASLHALHRLLLHGNSGVVSADRTKPRRQVHPDTERLHEVLWNHHLPTRGEARFDSLTGKQMEERLHLDQYQVSRRLGELMRLVPDLKLRGMTAYKVLCKTGRIKSELLRLGVKCNLPDAERHFQVNDPDEFEDPKSPRPGRP